MAPVTEIKKLAADIKKGQGQEALILLHHNADADVLGSSMALARGLAQLKIKAKIAAPAGISRQAKAVLAKWPYPIDEKVEDWPSLIFILDAVSPEQLGIEIPKEAKFILIDHHAAGELARNAALAILEPQAHSVAFLLRKIFAAAKIEITREIAFFLLISAAADTQYLRLINKEELAIVAELAALLGEELDMEDVYAALSVPEDISERIAKLKAGQRADIFQVRGLLVVFSEIGSYEASAASNFVKSGADMAFVFNVQKEEIRISARERVHLKEKLNLAELLLKAEPLIKGHAGGHATAASANGSNTKSMDAVKNILLAELRKRFGEPQKI